MSASPMVSNQMHGREEREEERNVEEKGWSRALNGGRDGDLLGRAQEGCMVGQSCCVISILGVLHQDKIWGSSLPCEP